MRQPEPEDERTRPSGPSPRRRGRCCTPSCRAGPPRGGPPAPAGRSRAPCRCAAAPNRRARGCSWWIVMVDIAFPCRLAGRPDPAVAGVVGEQGGIRPAVEANPASPLGLRLARRGHPGGRATAPGGEPARPASTARLSRERRVAPTRFGRGRSRPAGSGADHRVRDAGTAARRHPGRRAADGPRAVRPQERVPAGRQAGDRLVRELGAGRPGDRRSHDHGVDDDDRERARLPISR